MLCMPSYLKVRYKPGKCPKKVINAHFAVVFTKEVQRLLVLLFHPPVELQEILHCLLSLCKEMLVKVKEAMPIFAGSICIHTHDMHVIMKYKFKVNLNVVLD